MRKTYFCLLFCFAVYSMGYAQTSYTGAVGLGIDFGDGATFVGPSGKYFFSENHVGQADIGFEDGATLFTFLYSYHKEFDGAAGLRWYAGAGPSIILIEDADTIFALRPHAGLDFKINGVPLVFNFDWRPALNLTDNGDRFEAGAFGLGFRYAFD